MARKIVFKVKASNGKVYPMPRFMDLPARVVREISKAQKRNVTEEEVAEVMNDTLLDYIESRPDTAELMDDCSFQEVADFLGEWMDKEGEQQALESEKKD